MVILGNALNGDGVVDSFYSFLWKKSFDGTS
jgi:hypothetical protein